MVTLRSLLPLAALVLAACGPRSVADDPTVSVQDLKTVVDGGAYLLDVRTQAEYDAGHIRGAHNLPLEMVEGWTDELPNGPIYVICHSGNRSAQASAILKKAGKDVKNVGGGMNDWLRAGYPVVH